MSGGHFDYNQHRMVDIADSIRSAIDKYGDDFSSEAVNKMKEGVRLIQQAYVYAHRIDWLISGDDGDKEFLARLAEDLAKLDSTDSDNTETVDFFNRINQFDDALWVKNYGNVPARIEEAFHDLAQDAVEEILTGYWKLMHRLLNGELNVSAG